MSSLYEAPNRGRVTVISGGFARFNSVESVLGGTVQVTTYPAVKFDPARPVWPQIERMDLHPTVRFYIHNLNWLDFLVDSALVSEDPQSSPAGKFARDVAGQWWSEYQKNPQWFEDEYVWGGHGVAIRTAFLTVLSELWPEEEWIKEALAYHAHDLVKRFDGYWNHGLTQSLALVMAASRLSDDDMRELGAQRAKDCLGVMIDGEGAINEQAPEYASYIERLLRETIKVLKLYELPGVGELEEKKALVREFIAHAVTPGGTYVEIGDSVPRRPNYMRGEPIEFVYSNGVAGKVIPPVKVYSNGYIFGRSGFGQARHNTEETYYAVHFGPSRQIHGHFDHLSPTFWAEGRRIIVDPGHVGYKRGPERNYAQSRESHNVVVPRGITHDPATGSQLVYQSIDKPAQSFDLIDKGYAGAEWKRSMTFADCGPFVVSDKIEGLPRATHIDQRWNIAPEFDLVGTNEAKAEFRSRVDGLRLVLIRFLVVDGNVYATSDCGLLRGDRETLRGHVAREEVLEPCWNVSFGASGKSFQMMTAVATVPYNEKVTWSFREHGEGSRILRIRYGRRYFAFAYDVATGAVRPHKISWPQSRGEGGLIHLDA